MSKLDTRLNRLIKVDTEIPSQMCAHQVIFIPATARSPKGAVYVFGGLVDYGHYQRANFRYDIAANSWKRLDDWQNNHYRISFNLLPLVDNRFILVVSEKDPYLFDTQRDCWIRIEQECKGCQLEGVQIGAFTLPISSTFKPTPA